MTIEINEEQRKLIIKYLKWGLVYSKEACTPQSQEILMKFAKENDYIEQFVQALEKENEDV